MQEKKTQNLAWGNCPRVVLDFLINEWSQVVDIISWNTKKQNLFNLT
jgi:hypothetical protein